MVIYGGFARARENGKTRWDSLAAGRYTGCAFSKLLTRGVALRRFRSVVACLVRAHIGSIPFFGFNKISVICGRWSVVAFVLEILRAPLPCRLNYAVSFGALHYIKWPQ